jgi:anti-sigma B factor antagonist
VVPLTASVTAHDSYIVMELEGEADMTSMTTLESLLRDETDKEPGLLIIDLSGLRFMDSSVLQVILRAHRALAANGGVLALVNPHHIVARILRMTEADRIVPVYASVREAALSVRP